jgi:hypothetical protein
MWDSSLRTWPWAIVILRLSQKIGRCLNWWDDDLRWFAITAHRDLVASLADSHSLDQDGQSAASSTNSDIAHESRMFFTANGE